MEGNMFKKGLVVGIIILFFGVSMAPGITANINLSENTLTTISKSEELNSDLVEITVKICGTKCGKESRVELSMDVYNELKNIFDNLKIKLDNSKTRDERNSILNNAIISLDDLGILPEYISVEELQQLVTGVNHNLRLPFLFEWLKFKSRNQQNDNENHNCQITGEATGTWDFRLRDMIYPPFAVIRWALDIFLQGFPRVNIFKFLSIGVTQEEFGYHPEIKPSSGWIWTDGRDGVVEWSGRFYGGIKTIFNPFSDPEVMEWWHFGVSGFTGIRIRTSFLVQKHYMMGNAVYVNLIPHN